MAAFYCRPAPAAKLVVDDRLCVDYGNEMKAINDLTIRRATDEDAQAVLDLMIRYDIAESGEADSEMADLRHDWTQIDRAQDSWLLLEPAGALVGYGAVQPWGDSCRLNLYADPEWPNGDLFQKLLDLSLNRAREKAAASDGKFGAVAITTHTNEAEQALLRENHFVRDRTYFNFRIEFDGVQNRPDWPDGLTLRTFVPGQDNAATHAVIDAAFAQPGRKPTTLAAWQDHMLRPGSYDPDLFFLVEEAGELVAACLCFDYASGGWVRQLGVLEAARRRGIGQRLLHHCFHIFQKRGHTNVGLATDTSRPDAQTFYLNAGMHILRQYNAYVRWLRD